MSSRIRLLTATCALAVGAVSARAEGPAGRIHGCVYGPDGTRLPEPRWCCASPATGRRPASPPASWGSTARRRCRPVPGRDGRARRLRLRAQPAVEVEAGSDRLVDFTLESVVLSESLTSRRRCPRQPGGPRIRESGARDPGEALASVPGLSRVRKGGIANDVVVRGLQARDLSVLVDGQRVHGACPNRMDPAVFHVDFAEVDRIEVGKGPSTSAARAASAASSTWSPARRARLARGAAAVGRVVRLREPLAHRVLGERARVGAGGLLWRQSDVYEDGSGQPFTQAANYAPPPPEPTPTRSAPPGARGGRAVPAPPARRRVHRPARGRDPLPYLFMDAGWDNMDRANVRYDVGRADERRASPPGLLVARRPLDGRPPARVRGRHAPRLLDGTMARTRTGGGRLQGTRGGTTAGLEAYVRSWTPRTRWRAWPTCRRR